MIAPVVPETAGALNFTVRSAPLRVPGVSSRLHAVSVSSAATHPPDAMKSFDGQRDMGLNRLNTLSQAGVPIWITELDVQAVDENKRADSYEKALTAFYSHPNVEGILFWGFWDQSHWRGEKAALVKGDNLELTAAGRRVLDLFENQWMTEVTKSLVDVTGGQFTVRGFHGDYEVHVYRSGQEIPALKQNFTLEKSSDHAVTVTLP